MVGRVVSRRSTNACRARVGTRLIALARLLFLPALVGIPACALVPRARMDECQQLAQTLRSENARIKDRMLALQGQNRDLTERAVDDAKQLAEQEDAIERLEHSVTAYQDERNRLEAAYKQLAASVGAGQSDPPDGRVSQAAPKTGSGGATAAPKTARAGADSDAPTPR
jgi:septal ring factor EnvC (AmiA/AmiB activator)